MSDQNVQQPTHRVSFAQKQIDEDGREVLGRPVEIGAVWARRDPDKTGGILRFNIIPKDIDQGVIFVVENERERAQTQGSERGDAFDKVNERAASRPRGRGRGR